MTGNIPSSYKGNTGKNNVIEYMEGDVYKLPDSDFSKSSARVFDKIYNRKAGFLPSSIFFTSLKHNGYEIE